MTSPHETIVARCTGMMERAIVLRMSLHVHACMLASKREPAIISCGHLSALEAVSAV